MRALFVLNADLANEKIKSFDWGGGGHNGKTLCTLSSGTRAHSLATIQIRLIASKRWVAAFST